MKKLFTLLILYVMIPSAALAAPGNIVGHIYPTDIKTYAFDKEITAYNIDGETVIPCEDLAYFGMDVVWDNDTRILTVTDKRNPYEYRQTDIQRDLLDDYLPGGDDCKYIYESDISVIFNDAPIRAYALNGKMGVVAEDLRNYGYEVIWNADALTLCIEQKGNIDIETDIGRFYANGKIESSLTEEYIYFYLNRFIKDNGEELSVPCIFDTLPKNYPLSVMMLPAKTICDFLNIGISVKDNNIYIDTTNACRLKDAKSVGYCYPDGTPLQESNENIGIFFDEMSFYKDITYPYIEKVFVDGKEIEQIYKDIWGKPNMHGSVEAEAEKKPYIYNNILYIPFELITQACFDMKLNLP